MTGTARWKVRPGDGTRLVEVLARMGEGALGAAREGRAFVNGKRVRDDHEVRPGDEIVVYAPRAGEGAEARILLDAGGLVLADKPPALPTTPDRRGERSLLGEVSRLLATPVASVHAASRLDVGVSGVVLCAVGETAQRHVAAMREAGRIHRVYVGIGGGELTGAGTWDAAIGKRTGPSGRARAAALGRDAEPAVTRWTALAHARGPSGRGPRATLFRFEPITGRTHQIRVHAAAAGAPLLGDREHGGARTLVDGGGRVTPLSRIALHARAVELPGFGGEPVRAVAAVPDDLRAIWKALDGAAEAWDEDPPLDPR